MSKEPEAIEGLGFSNLLTKAKSEEPAYGIAKSDKSQIMFMETE